MSTHGTEGRCTAEERLGCGAGEEGEARCTVVCVGRGREQSAWEVFFGFLIFFTVACEGQRGKEEKETERASSARIPFEAHPTQPKRRSIFSWETFVELQIEVAGRREEGGGDPGAAANGHLKYGFMSRFLPLPAKGGAAYLPLGLFLSLRSRARIKKQFISKFKLVVREELSGVHPPSTPPPPPIIPQSRNTGRDRRWLRRF